jgi:hypothetical protein
MKLRSVFIGIICLSAFTACKLEKRYKLSPLPPQYAETKGTGKVTVILKAVVTQDDTFQLFYTQDGSQNYSQDLSLFAQVKASDKAQDIIFNFPDEALPSALRIDFGENKNQEEIIIENLDVKYYDKTLTISAADFVTYYQPNEILKREGNTTVVTPKVIDDNYDPMIFSNDKFSASVKTILTKE